MWYAERTKMRYNAVDRIFYDAIKVSRGRYSTSQSPIHLANIQFAPQRGIAQFLKLLKATLNENKSLSIN
ncbi:MAG: hypothetical protein HY885_09900 [Deltaproteobacteria bacterium]|nr:hypothetical protein [Deltaproteobacteria bacterium]